MEKQDIVGCLESLLFASGRVVDKKTLMEIMEVSKEDIIEAANSLKNSLLERNSGIQLIEINDGYQLATVEKFYTQVCTLLDNRPKPSLSQAAMEVLAIIAYNPKVTRAEVEKIRGVSSDSAMNKLLEYNLIEEAGRMDAPGRPTMYKTTDEFLRLFGYKSLSDMPELPKLKEDDGQISLDDFSEDDEQKSPSNDDIESKKESTSNENDALNDDIESNEESTSNKNDALSDNIESNEESASNENDALNDNIESNKESTSNENDNIESNE